MARWPYSTDRWQRLRRTKLAMNPLCEYCPPYSPRPARHVDHKVSIRDGGEVWDLDNLASCCPECHNRKTARLDGAFGNKKRKGYGCDVAGKPLDPDHWWWNK